MNSNTNSTPTRFRCKVGGEWKDISAFSNAQQRNLKYNSKGIDAAHSGMTCKEHSAGSRAELRCELCRLVKPIDEFSKSSRRKGEYQCRRCVAWIEIQEPSLTPGPLETGHISPEEEQQQMLRQRFVTSEDFFHDDDDDDDDLVPRAPVTTLASLGLDEEMATRILGSNASIAEFLSRGDTTASRSRTSSTLPPHLRSKAASEAASSFSAAASETSSMAGDAAAGLPPHLRAKYQASAASVPASSVSGAGMSLPTTLREAAAGSDGSGASILHRSFNAWGPAGDMQRHRTATMSGDSASDLLTETESASSAAYNDDPNVVGDWGPPAKTKKTTAMAKGKGRFGARAPRMSSAEIRESLGDVHQPYMRRDIDTQKRVRPIGYGSDDDSD